MIYFFFFFYGFTSKGAIGKNIFSLLVQLEGKLCSGRGNPLSASIGDVSMLRHKTFGSLRQAAVRIPDTQADNAAHIP